MRLIDADKLETHEQLKPFENGNYEYVEVVYKDDIDYAPTIKSEQKKGKWVDAVLYHEPDDFEWEKVKCSSCKIFVTKPIFYHNNKYNFCPNCGADMRSE